MTLPDLLLPLIGEVVLLSLVGSEFFQIGHYDPGQAFRIHDRIFRYKIILVEQKGREGINLFVREGARILKRHRSPNVVENRGCIRPEAANGFAR